MEAIASAEAIVPLLDKELPGFGEIFRIVSYQEIKTSTVQSRALAGVANGTYIFCLPGSSCSLNVPLLMVRCSDTPATPRPGATNIP